MGEITWDMRRTYGRHVDQIPADVLARIDHDEILDRLDEAQTLVTKFEKAPGDFATGYLDQARRILAAGPRDEVEAAAQKWVQKAEAAHTPQHASECRRQARVLREAQPAATRRPRKPSAEQVRHAEAVAAFKADVLTSVWAEVAQLQASATARQDQLQAGVAELMANVAEIRKAAEPHMTKVETVNGKRR